MLRDRPYVIELTVCVRACACVCVCVRLCFLGVVMQHGMFCFFQHRHECQINVHERAQCINAHRAKSLLFIREHLILSVDLSRLSFFSGCQVSRSRRAFFLREVSKGPGEHYLYVR